MMILLALTGFVQSIFWTATNAFVFADVDDKDAGQANVISQVGVQLSLAFGVALGGGALELFRLGHGGEPTLLDFHYSFYVIAAVGIVSTLVFSRLPRNAGANLSGHGGGGGGH
jgi:predicted MFS family arabinose efflux permease